MSRINYIKGNLFYDIDADILLHACNCKGNWGAGIAKEFAKRFPDAYKVCRQLAEYAVPGDFQYAHDLPSNRLIGWLITSQNYGKSKDSVTRILVNTHKALIQLEYYLEDRNHNFIIASPKINSGLFRVPWELTEELIEDFLSRNKHITWRVYELA